MGEAHTHNEIMALATQGKFHFTTLGFHQAKAIIVLGLHDTIQLNNARVRHTRQESYVLRHL